MGNANARRDYLYHILCKKSRGYDGRGIVRAARPKSTREFMICGWGSVTRGHSDALSIVASRAPPALESASTYTATAKENISITSRGPLDRAVSWTSTDPSSIRCGTAALPNAQLETRVGHTRISFLAAQILLNPPSFKRAPKLKISLVVEKLS